MRVFRPTVWASACLLCALLLACGGDERGRERPTTDSGVSDTSTTPPPDGGAPPPPPVTASCGEVDVGHRLVTLGWERGLLQESTGRILSFPDMLTSSLSAIPVLTLTDAGGSVSSVAVTGDVPDGSVYGSTYHAALDRFIVLTWSRSPEPHYDLSAVELSESEARFTVFELVDPLPSDGYQIQEIFAMSDNRVAMLRGIDVLYQVTIDGTTATFSDGIPVSTVGLPSVWVQDPTANRLIGYGQSFDPAMPLEEAFLPYVATLSLETGGAWTEVPAFGETPEELHGEDALGIYEPFMAYDPASQKLTVLHPRWTEDPFFPGERYPEPLLYALDVNAGVWSLVSETPGIDVHAGGHPWLVDPENHRTISVTSDVIESMSLEGETAGQLTSAPLEGSAGLRFTVSANALPDGRIAATDRSGRVLVLETSVVPSWSRLGDALIPHAYRAQGTLFYDPVGASLMLFGGANTHSDPGSNALHRIALDGTTIEEVSLDPAPPPRAYHSSLVVGDELYIAGGWASGAIEAETHDDVWELDLSAMRWRQLATLPVGRAGMGMMVSGTELWLIGGRSADAAPTLVGTPRVDAIDLASGAVREVPITGAWPERQGIFYGDAPLGDGYFAFDIVDDTIDGNTPGLWLLSPDDAGGAAWTQLGSCLIDGVVAGTVGVTLGPDQVWAVGENVFSISR